MANKQIDAVLWRTYLTSTSDALWGTNTSQYYIDLPKSDYENFFGATCQKALDRDGNETFTITIEAFDGVPRVERSSLTFKKLRKGTAREGTWNINDQSPEKAYDLWRKMRGPLKTFSAMDIEERSLNYLVIVRDLDGGFHGRWIQATDFAALPEGIREILTKTTAGWKML